MCRFALLLLPLLTGCAEYAAYSGYAIEKRRMMNDRQARATMSATCDIALGSFFRELTATERRYVAVVCGGDPGSIPSAPAPSTLPRRGKPTTGS